MTEKLIFNDVMKHRLIYTQRHITRHGKVVWYFRVGKGPRTRLRGKYGSEEFMQHYNAALSGVAIVKNISTNSLSWLIDRYKKSSAWALLSKGSRKQRDYHFYSLRKTAGSVPYKAIKRQNIIDGIDKRRSTPGAANTYLKTLRGLFKWAREAEYISTDPTNGISKIKYKSNGFPAWNEEDVIRFREYWPVGSRERLAMELLYWTGLRRGDIVKIGKQHIKDGVIMLPTEKTGETVYITLPPLLQNIIDQSPTGDLAFISTMKGQPRKKESFGNWFREICNKAGVKKSAHGLRKTAATLLAEAGGTEKELQAAFGWTSESQSKIYTKAADRKRLALKAGQKRLEDGRSNPTPNTLDPTPNKLYNKINNLKG